MRVLVCALGAAVLAACGQSAPPAEPPAVETTAPAELALDSLVGADISGRMSGELGCSFTTADGVQVLTAMGFVASQERAEAVVIHNGAVMELQAVEQEGFDGLDDGATFNGEGLSAEVTSGAAIDTGHEGVASTATLTARAGEQQRVYEGTWSCGP